MALCLTASPAVAQTTRGQQIIASLKPQCEAQRDAALSTIAGSTTPAGRLSIGATLDAYTDARMADDSQVLVERDIPEMTSKAAADPARAPQFRYFQCLLVARARQLASHASGVLPPEYQDSSSYGPNARRFLQSDLRQFCQAERSSSEDFDRRVLRESRPEAYDKAYEDIVSDSEALSAQLRSIAWGGRDDLSSVALGTSPPAPYNRFTGCVHDAHVQQFARLRAGTLAPPVAYSGAQTGALMAGAEPGLSPRQLTALLRAAPVPSPSPSQTGEVNRAGGTAANGLPANGATPSGSAAVSLPRPAAGAIDAPVVVGSNTNGPTRLASGAQTSVLGAPESWKTRTLTLSSEFAALRPVDVFVDFFNDGNVNAFVGRDYASAVATDATYIGGRNTGQQKSSCSQVLGKTTVAWFAALQVAHQLPPEWTSVEHHYTNAFVCGGASLDEAIAGAYDLAKQEAGGRPFSTFHLQAGVTAEVDYGRLRQEGRLPNALRPAALLPWSFVCDMPLSLDDAQATFMPRDPGSGPAFAQYVRTLPDSRQFSFQAPVSDRRSTYLKTSWLGCHGYYLTLVADQAPPVLGPRQGPTPTRSNPNAPSRPSASVPAPATPPAPAAPTRVSIADTDPGPQTTAALDRVLGGPVQPRKPPAQIPPVLVGVVRSGTRCVDLRIEDPRADPQTGLMALDWVLENTCPTIQLVTAEYIAKSGPPAESTRSSTVEIVWAGFHPGWSHPYPPPESDVGFKAGAWDTWHYYMAPGQTLRGTRWYGHSGEQLFGFVGSCDAVTRGYYQTMVQPQARLSDDPRVGCANNIPFGRRGQ